ncbi:MAG: GNAT family N-acetyltransferase [Bacilli bacterium]|nr:GNAT family N-acetyltransferase [Bacilli bacterium]
MKNTDELIIKYMNNPCHTLSIPYWKNRIIKVPEHIHIIHKDDYVKSKYKKMKTKRFFRLYHDLKEISGAMEKSKYFPETYEDKDIEELRSMMNDCYRDEEISVSLKSILSWKKHPTYEEDLWIVIKNEFGEIIASGIAEVDREIGEGILEWIQVLPKYQHQGFGKMIVFELLRRLKGKAKFVTVSGSLENNSNPEKLYRSCGFTGNDVWYICTDNE